MKTELLLEALNEPYTNAIKTIKQRNEENIQILLVVKSLKLAKGEEAKDVIAALDYLTEAQQMLNSALGTREFIFNPRHVPFESQFRLGHFDGNAVYIEKPESIAVIKEPEEEFSSDSEIPDFFAEEEVPEKVLPPEKEPEEKMAPPKPNVAGKKKIAKARK